MSSWHIRKYGRHVRLIVTECRQIPSSDDARVLLIFDLGKRQGRRGLSLFLDFLINVVKGSISAMPASL